ncbi:MULTISPECIES: YitT family protein [Enterococcus]|uniref:Membrane protein n=1 Tax=Enterococcus thailandicus TaxID=417368 RepID=A0A179ETD8_ENTTH|nr:YitT family protein [Enterococcus thailandicus]ASZ07636.1 YitT family protein [Enterococcus thailandicus]MDK4351019.1 YitT family protein [Enterococcus thailandicus]MDT2733329.1 YitT family protein [Enterococcus thailandicus]MDT2750672.1 YitT family protein [Enterococcus thailandicus]MDT2775231.1 YitT family protein [Enterococcus thailandicus]
MRQTKDFIWTYIKILFALLILGVSINLFLGPHHVAAGGVSGLGILFESAFGMNRALVILALNSLMLVLAILFLGKKLFLKVLFGSIVFPLVIAIVPETMVTSDRLLSVIFGSAIFALGVAILYNNNSSSGGTTIPPLIFKKYFHLNTSIGLLLTDAVVVSLNLLIFGFEEFLYAILSIVITSIVMTYIETGLNRKKSIMIMSEDSLEEIRIRLTAEIGRGLTLLEAKGGYNRKPKEVLLIVTTDQEFTRIKPLIKEIDPTAFVIANNVAEVTGSGFTYHPIE